MSLLHLSTIVTYLVCCSSAAVLDQAYKLFPSDTTSASNTSSLTITPSPTSASNISTGNGPRIICNEKGYDVGLSIESCSDAISLISMDETQKEFGHRTTGDWDVKMPYRYLSRDGLCAIDITSIESRQADLISDHEIHLAATGVYNACVRGNSPHEPIPRSGGVAFGIGKYERLEVTIRRYSPATVTCDIYGSAPAVGSVEEILGKMPVDTGTQRFGPYSVPGLMNDLPHYFIASDRKCKIKIDTTGDVDRYSWYNFWTAAVAVNAMCCRFGKAGTISNLGTDHALTLSLYEDRRGNNGNDTVAA